MKTVCRAVFVFTLAFFGACSNRRTAVSDPVAPSRVLERMPRWFAEDGVDSLRLLARATAISGDMQTALDIARTQARADMALQVEARTSVMAKQFREQLGATASSELLAQFTVVSQDVAAETLRGVRVRRHEMQAEGSAYRAYVVLELPAGEAPRQLLARLQQNQRVRTEVRAVQAFEELTREVERLDVRRDSTRRSTP